MEMEVSRKTGAGLYERRDERHNYRNGYRERWWDTRAGTISLNIPRLRSGTYFPSLLEPRRRTEQALLSVVQEAYVLGVSTRKVDKLVKALGMDGISKSEVSRICQKLDEEVNRWRNRLLEGTYPYLWLDATYIKARDNGRVTNLAVVVAYGVRETGEREIIGIDIGPSEKRGLLGSLVSRGLKGCTARRQRCPCRIDKCHCHYSYGCWLAAVPGALHEECSGQGTPGCPIDGGSCHSHYLYPAL